MRDGETRMSLALHPGYRPRQQSGAQVRYSLFCSFLYRVLYVLELGDFHVADLAANLLDAANVDRVDDVARVGIDRDRAARAFPFHAFDRADETVAIGLAAG